MKARQDALSHTWETPVLALYQYVLPSSVLCSDHTEAAAGFAIGACWAWAGYPEYACCRTQRKRELEVIREDWKGATREKSVRI
jgi:hypothetical protein